MPEGTGTVAVWWANNRFLAYDRHKLVIANGGAKFAHHIVVDFYSIVIVWILYMPVNRLYIYIYFNCSRRKVNIVSHLIPVLGWSIVSWEIILLPAELIPLPEEANRSRP